MIVLMKRAMRRVTREYNNVLYKYIVFLLISSTVEYELGFQSLNMPILDWSEDFLSDLWSTTMVPTIWTVTLDLVIEYISLYKRKKCKERMREEKYICLIIGYLYVYWIIYLYECHSTLATC